MLPCSLRPPPTSVVVVAAFLRGVTRRSIDRPPLPQSIITFVVTPYTSQQSSLFAYFSPLFHTFDSQIPDQLNMWEQLTQFSFWRAIQKFYCSIEHTPDWPSSRVSPCSRITLTHLRSGWSELIQPELPLSAKLFDLFEMLFFYLSRAKGLLSDCLPHFAFLLL